jgi:formyltetrahydrofolate hydrolase
MKRLWKTEAAMKKTIITVVGKDTVGIIARVCTYLAENQINILDISQTIVQGYFNMMMIVPRRILESLQKSWNGWVRASVLSLNAKRKRYLIRCTGSSMI